MAQLVPLQHIRIVLRQPRGGTSATTLGSSLPRLAA
jgi:hypothetical protein